MKQYVGLVVLEHLSHKLDVQVLDVDFLDGILGLVYCDESKRLPYLQTFVQYDYCFVEFLLAR